MLQIIIDIPDLNDCFQSVTLDNKRYLLRTTWNEAAQRWSFGLYTTQKEPILVGMRIVPRFPLGFQYSIGLNGVFGVHSDLPHVGRKDFVNGKAKFVYIPVEV